MDRRRALKIGGVGVAAAWVAPVLISSPAFGAATSGIPVNPLCNGQTCDSFTGDCYPLNKGNCFCYSTPTGLGICETSQSCAALTACPNGQGDCPAGTVCIINSCCGSPVCVVLTDQCGNIPLPAAAAPKAAAGTGPTTTHR